MRVSDKNCSDSWERFSSSISSLSLNLLPALLFVLIMSYLITGNLREGITLNINGQQANITYPPTQIPIDYAAIKTAVLYLFGAILIGLPVPLFSGKFKPLKILISLVQAGAFVYGLYIFVFMIIKLANSLT